MKKTSLLLLLSMLAASGCGKSGLAAGQISYSGKTLTYGENKVEDVFFTDGVELTLNNENEIRSITITNKEVKTYKNISVGDKIEKVQSDYNYENEIGNTILVTIDDDKEIDPETENKPEDTIYINYYYDNDTITKIAIYDAIYATTMR